jgi:lipoprotein-anchoring transpeptidase ErfK/SrfK
MRRSPLSLSEVKRAAAIVALCLVWAVPASAQVAVPTVIPDPVVMPGVTIAGIDVSGKTRQELMVTLRGRVHDAVKRPVTVGRNGERATLKARRADQRFFTGKTADRVMAAEADTAVAPVVDLSTKAVFAFLRDYAPRVAREGRNASIDIRLTRIRRVSGKPGKRLEFKPISRAVKAALRDPLKPHTLRAPLERVDPEVTGKELRSLYPAIITIDQSTFTLRLFKRLRYDRSYSVAVGTAEYPTPNGLFAIQSKQVNPTWTAPNSPWAGEAAGQSFDSSDPNNPLRARWMGVNGSVGIHGTGEDYSIGTRASHGCIRMHEGDVIDLYDRVHIGTPVLIAP